MCALCGAFGGEEHWSTRAEAPGQTRRAERLARVRAANAVLGAFAMRLDDWQGAAFVISGATGRREVVDTLPQVWEMAGRMLGRSIDPLDPELIARMTQRMRQ
ncbi:MAG: hypothetical protein JWQ55_4635 [Rhodopila sp.]|jgi:hypothetical protein|nr:hypothetical protein [Rhodopila sp.]